MKDMAQIFKEYEAMIEGEIWKYVKAFGYDYNEAKSYLNERLVRAFIKYDETLASIPTVIYNTAESLKNFGKVIAKENSRFIEYEDYHAPLIDPVEPEQEEILTADAQEVLSYMKAGLCTTPRGTLAYMTDLGWGRKRTIKAQKELQHHFKYLTEKVA